jgi:hypothetical protein
MQELNTAQRKETKTYLKSVPRSAKSPDHKCSKPEIINESSLKGCHDYMKSNIKEV